MDNISVVVEYITPQKAQEYLSRNLKNRKLRSEAANTYAKAMAEGEWYLSNDAITFDEDGNLTNGQHRLTGVKISGRTIPFVVMRMLPRESILAFDNGIARTSGDQLKLKNVKNANAVASIVRKKLELEKRRSVLCSANGSPHHKILNAIVDKAYYENKGMYDYITEKAIKLYNKRKILSISDYGGIMAHLHMDLKHNLEVVEDFFDEFCELKPVTNSVIEILRGILINDMASTTKMTSLKKTKLIIKAWNAYVTGKTPKMLKFFPEQDKNLWYI